jgi:hypothetical protein
MERERSHQSLAAIADDCIYIGRFAAIDVAGAFEHFLFGGLQAAKVILRDTDASGGCEVGAAVGAS